MTCLPAGSEASNWKNGGVDSDPSSHVAAVVLTYHPDPDVVINIDAVRAQVARVYIVNNSPDDASARTLAPFSAQEDVVILDQPGNVGVATGFNTGMRAALADGFDDVWIFDQDSTVTDGLLRRLLDARDAAGVRPASSARRCGPTRQESCTHARPASVRARWMY